jgi:hypothetical protein
LSIVWDGVSLVTICGVWCAYWVEILASVRHEVEAGHEADEVDQEKPVLLQSDLALSDECACNAWTSSRALGLTLAERLGLGQAQTEEDDEDRRAGSEPE